MADEYKSVDAWAKGAKAVKGDLKDMADIAAVMQARSEEISKSIGKQGENMGDLLEASIKATKEGKMSVDQLKSRSTLIQEIAKGELTQEQIASKKRDIEDEITAIRRRYKGANQDIGEQMIKQKESDIDMLNTEQDRTKAAERSNKLFEVADSLMGGMLSGAQKFVTTMMANPLVAILTAALFIIQQFDATLGAVGKEFGAVGLRSAELQTSLLQADTEARKLGKGMEDVLTVSRNLTDEFGFGLQESIGLSNNIIDTSVALGLTTDEGSKLVGTLSTVGGLTADTSQTLMKQVTLLAKSNDVAPKAVLKDIAESSSAIAQFTNGSVDNLARASIQAKSLGTDLNTITTALKGTLDFETSLTAEREASVLIGRTLNLQKVRELTLANDIEGAQLALTEQLGTQAEFEAMNVLQREALAKATGVSVEQMATMLSQQEKAVTLAGELAGQPGFEELVGEKGITQLAQLTGQLQSMGALLIQTLGPALNIVLMVLNGVLKLLHIIQTPARMMAEWFGGAATGLTAAPSLQGGGQVTKTGLAEVHKGETVGMFDSTAIVDAISGLKTDFRDMNNTMGNLKLETNITNKDLNVVLTPSNA